MKRKAKAGNREKYHKPFTLRDHLDFAFGAVINPPQQLDSAGTVLRKDFETWRQSIIHALGSAIDILDSPTEPE